MERSVVGAAVGMAAFCVGSYVYGVSDRGEVLDPSLVIIIAFVGLFNGWLLFALLRGRRSARGAGGDGDRDGWR